MKKLFALILALALVASLAVPAMAESRSLSSTMKYYKASGTAPAVGDGIEIDYDVRYGASIALSSAEIETDHVAKLGILIKNTVSVNGLIYTGTGSTLITATSASATKDNSVTVNNQKLYGQIQQASFTYTIDASYTRSYSIS